MRMQPQTQLVTGRDFGMARIAIGATPHAVGQLLGGVAHQTILRWESDLRPVPTERAQRWRTALRLAAGQRAASIEAQGYRVVDVISRSAAMQTLLLVGVGE